MFTEFRMEFAMWNCSIGIFRILLDLLGWFISLGKGTFWKEVQIFAESIKQRERAKLNNNLDF